MTTVLGLRANWRQFALLVAVSAFVGAMVGIERSVLPVLATDQFHVASTTAVLLFIASFGLTKAATNLLAGWLADHGARRRVLLLGWLAGMPVPALILLAPSWWWVVAANALLGVNQGLTWSMTVLMKIDLVGGRNRGLAVGLNESAGYLAVAGASLVSGFAAARYGLREGAAWAGFVIAGAGFLLSCLVRDTRAHVQLESRTHPAGAPGPGERPRIGQIFRRSLWTDARLFSISQAGLVNNLNDGLAWGVFPLLFLSSGMSLRQMSLLAAIYPAVWSLSQLGTGPLSDRWGRRALVVAGMLLQGAALVAIGLADGYAAWIGGLAALGLGTALVYPTLLAAVGDHAHPSWRGAAVGVYRLWRDLGYVAGALLAGILSDVIGMAAAVIAVGLLTALSGLLFALRFDPKA